MTRRFYADHPPRAEYVLSDKGGELGVVGHWRRRSASAKAAKRS